MRRNECGQGVEILRKYNPEINALRDVDFDFLNTHKNNFPDTVFKRCKFVVGENLRVEKAFDALVKGDIKLLGELMFQSHQGLKNDYEVSCHELDVLEEIARRTEGVIGARMMGGGFGGCTINIVRKEVTKDFSEKISQEYKKICGVKTEIHLVEIGNGTE
jgi:galactokinase